MGRWDDEEREYDRYRQGYSRGKGRIGARGVRRIILIGFAVLGIVMISFFVSRAGLHVALHERAEAVGTVQVVSAQISNNSFETMRNVTVQFGENNPAQPIGDLEPFSGALVSPEGDDYEFDRVIVTANNGAVTVVHYR
ncbi:MAG TPA: hypothetical protein VNI77_03640 [Nitrososphaera sp.]|nr:hypothetical protein [Nitrososphaera sp.]